MQKATLWRCALKLAVLAVLVTMSWETARAGDGAVYMMTNAADGNQLAVFARDNKGLLEFPVFYNTGGLGAGTGLGSQGSIAVDAAGDTLYLVNAGDGSISVFDLSKKKPDLIQVISSGGTFPNSVAVSGDLLYVLNAGEPTARSTSLLGSRSTPRANSPRWRIPRGRSAGRRCSPPRSAFPRTAIGSS